MHRRPKVFVAREIPDAGLDRIREATDAHIWPEELPPSHDILIGAVGDCEGLVSLLTDPVNEAVIDAAPRLKVISNYAVGYDNVDVPAATRAGIMVTNTPGVLTETTADLAFALLLAAARRIVEGHAYAAAGRWRTWGPKLLLGRDIHGSCLGIVGFGKIGRAVARRARGFHMTVLYHDIEPHPEAEDLGAEFCSLPELYRRADFISLHVPLTADTHHLIDATALERMGPETILINTSRGPVVDEAALCEALRSGRLGGAALDVTDPEPIDPGSPLLTLPNALVVPHIGSASFATRGLMAELAADNLLRALAGEVPRHLVNPEVLPRALREPGP